MRSRRTGIFREFSDDLSLRRQLILVFTFQQVHLTLASVTLPLHQDIRPFTINVAISSCDWTFYPCEAPCREVRGCTVPALITLVAGTAMYFVQPLSDVARTPSNNHSCNVQGRSWGGGGRQGA